MSIDLLIPEPITAPLPFDGIEVVRHPVSVRALGSVALTLLSPDEVTTLLDKPEIDHARQQVVEGCVRFSDGESDPDKLTDEDFRPVFEVQGLPAIFEKGIYVPEVKIQVTELDDLVPFKNLGVTELIVPALDLFPKDTGTSHGVLRVCDLRGIAGIDVDGPILEQQGNHTTLEDRFARDMAKTFMTTRFPSVRIAKKTLQYSKSSDDKLRTYWRFIGSDMSANTEDYQVSKTVVRLADCASRNGEDHLYRQLLGRGM